MTDPRPPLTSPRSYVDPSSEEGQARFRESLRIHGEQNANDIEFASAAGAIVTEGPWEHHPAQNVAYIGVDLVGERVVLPAISRSWRFGPDKNGWIVRKPDGVIVRRVYLGPPMPGMLVGRASGQMPVQANDLIDGHEYYFRSRGEHWSMSIGGAEIYSHPDWYYEEPYGTWPEAGVITEDQAYNFIALAANKFRSGVPTMTERTTDRASASILQAISALTKGETKA